jgi:hypothetical protein
VLANIINTSNTVKIARGRRIEFYPGRRKTGEIVNDKPVWETTGYYYWQWVYTDANGKRRRPYGGKWDTPPKDESYVGYWQGRKNEFTATTGIYPITTAREFTPTQ